jgi:hypothetical protein
MRVRFKVPLIGGFAGHALAGRLTKSDIRRITMDAEKKSRHLAVVKPQRKLGAPWIDSFVANRQSVALCEDCTRRYWKWWERYDYRPIWSPKDLTDCDGCSTHLTYCTTFYWWKTKTDWQINA